MEKWEPAVVTTGLNHYLGKGTANHNGLGPQDFAKIESLTKFSSPRLAPSKQDRGLLMPSTKQMRFGHLGPGSYTDLSMNAFIEKSFRRKQGTFGTSSRDAHFSKYSAIHSELVSKGIN